MKTEPCKPCAAARKVLPKSIRERLEAAERRMIERRKARRLERESRQA
jgi:hypothetical protein